MTRNIVTRSASHRDIALWAARWWRCVPTAEDPNAPTAARTELCNA